MRPIHLVRLDKTRPAVVLTRPEAWSGLTYLTVAPVTSTVRGLSSELPVGSSNGLDHGSVVACDMVTTVHRDQIGRRVGAIHETQEGALAATLARAFDLRIEDADV